MPDLRLPHEYGGRGPDPVGELVRLELSDGLAYRPDAEGPDRHGFIEPARRMSFEEYERAIRGTRRLWRPMR